MNLLVGLFLVLINSFNSATAEIPNSEGINALVAYLFTCIFFVFCAMLGYAGIKAFDEEIFLFLTFIVRDPVYSKQESSASW